MPMSHSQPKPQPQCDSLHNTSLTEVPITEQQYNQILAIQETILGMMAYQTNANTIFAKLCNLAESLLPNSVASIMMKDEHTHLMNVVSAPNVPPAGHTALSNLEPGPGGGSCGNAVFRNQPQFVQDTYTDSRWCNIRHIAYDFNLCSCWSMPIRNNEQQAIGSFALSSFEHRSPALFHKKLLETCAHIVSIVLKNQQLSARSQLYSSALKHAKEGMVITNKNNEIVEVNQAFEEITGYKEKDILHKNPSFLSSGKHSKTFYQQMWQRLKTQDKWSGEVINQRADGSLLPQWVNISVIRNEQGDIVNHFALFTDISDIKDYQQQISYMAYHDNLTQLFNKTALENELNANNSNKTLILLNINNFSYINMAYGFEVGDKLLVTFANTLKALASNAFIYRINADEFGLLYTQPQKEVAIIERIQQYFSEKTLEIDNISINISCNYGAVSANKNLFKNGALALKRAKEFGKNRYHIFDANIDNLDANTREAFVVYNNVLHQALENDNVIPFFQGIRDNNSKKITKYEVLARIKHQDKIITPFHFLEPAKLSGMLPEITKMIIDKSFAVMQHNQYSFSINITEDDLNHHYLLAFLTSKTQQYNIAPERVILEILEGVSSTGKSSQIEQLNLLKKQGFKLAIDDFGAEYSNFERILDLDIDFIKIDAKYIKNIHNDKKSYEITKAIAYFAGNAGVQCVAEFVHSEEVQQVIDELAIDFSQGYLFSEPQENL